MSADVGPGVEAGAVHLVIGDGRTTSGASDERFVIDGSAVVLDLDGVLADSHTAWVDAERRAVEELGGHWRPSIGGTAQGTAPSVASAELAARCGLDGRQRDVDEATRRQAVARFPDLVQPMDGARRFVASVVDLVPVAVATNAARPIAEVTLRSIGLADLLRVLVTVDDVPSGKPAPDVYLAAAALLEAQPRRCIAIDDTTTGLRAAVAAGMRTLAFGPPADVPDQAVGVIGGWSDVTVMPAP